MSNKVNNIPQHKTIQATPNTPDTGFGKIYIKNDKLWYGLDDLGVETLLSGGGGGGGIALIDLSAVLPLTYDNSTGSFSINQSSGSSDGFLTLGDWTTFNNKVAGSGTSDTITKWTNSNPSTIGDSCIKENTAGQSISVGTLATPTYQTPFLTQTTGTHYLGGWFANTHVYSGDKIGIIVDTQGNTSGRIVGIENRAGSQQSPPVDINIGIFTRLGLSSSSLQDYGLYVDSDVTNNTFANIGAYIKSANNGTGGKYSVQLRDGSEAAGKFLKSITVDGKANWANITAADVAGTVGVTTGTNNYVAKFTPNGTTIGNSQIRDDGTKIGINSAPEVGSKIYIISDQTTGINLNSNVSNINTAVGINLSVSGTNNLANTGIVSTVSGGNSATIGVQGSASSSTGVNKGIEGIASGTSTNIGLRGYAVGGSSNYSIQLQDGTQTVAGRFLKNMNTSGQANWANITAADVSGVQGSLTLTTIGSSGEATLVGNTLNIPQYSGGGGGGLTWPAHIEYDETDKTLWNNGKGNITTNTSYGQSALSTITSGYENSAFGNTALFKNTSGKWNSAFGNNSLTENTTGGRNSAFGSDTMAATTTGSVNSAFGYQALLVNTIGDSNTVIGAYSGAAITTGSLNTGVGQISLQQLTTGIYNTAIGYSAASSLTTGEYNISVGYSASPFPTKSSNVIIGVQASSNYDACVILGREAQSNANNQFVVGSSSYNVGALTTESVTANATWSVKINGQLCKILINR